MTAIADMVAALREFAATAETMRQQAFAADPGLEAAWREAQKKDQDIDWLDVAERRERQRQIRTGRIAK